LQMDESEDDSVVYEFRTELVNVKWALLVGGSNGAEQMVNGLSIRRWLALFVLRAFRYAEYRGTPNEDIMPIRTAWRRVKHEGTDFEGRRVSGFVGDELPRELIFERDVPTGFIGVSAFALPRELRALLRGGIDCIADIDQKASHMLAQAMRVSSEFNLTKKVAANIQT